MGADKGKRMGENKEEGKNAEEWPEKVIWLHICPLNEEQTRKKREEWNSNEEDVLAKDTVNH